jgi:hypothetical protein
MSKPSGPRRSQVEKAARRAQGTPIHAQLRDGDGRVLAGATLEDGEWTMVLAGRPVVSTPSAAMLLAMLRHTAAVQGRAGVRTRLSVSKVLDAAACAEAQAAGRTLAAHLDWLEAERRTRNDPAPALH